MKKNNLDKKGFVILIAVLLASIFALIGASIFNISVKELVLSSGSRDSQYAFYAADSGLDCALYWDLQHSVFATSTHSGSSPSGIYCADQDVTTRDDWSWKEPPTNDFKADTIFGFDLFPDDAVRKDCALVDVHKENGVTTIESRGYNTCDETDSRRVERALRIIY